MRTGGDMCSAKGSKVSQVMWRLHWDANSDQTCERVFQTQSCMDLRVKSQDRI